MRFAAIIVVSPDDCVPISMLAGIGEGVGLAVEDNDSSFLTSPFLTSTVYAPVRL